MKRVLFHIRDFYWYTFYLGAQVRRKTLSNKKIKDETFGLNIWFWLIFLNGYTIAAVIMPLVFDKQEFIYGINNGYSDDFCLGLGFLKLSLDYYTFYWKNSWVKIVNVFDSERDQQTKTVYLLVLLSILLAGVPITYFRWFYTL